MVVVCSTRERRRRRTRERTRKREREAEGRWREGKRASKLLCRSLVGKCKGRRSLDKDEYEKSLLKNSKPKTHWK